MKETVDTFCEASILQDVKIRYTTTPFNGSLTKETIYRQRPSPEVDAAWQDLGIECLCPTIETLFLLNSKLDKAIILTDKEADAAGIERNRLHVTERNGGPGYPAIVEVLHQLHCLNMLRQGLYFNVEYYQNLNEGSFTNDERILQLHIGHCLDILRQRLMCTADTGLHPFLWAGKPPHVYPDFNRDYKCRNFDDIRQYAKKHQAKWGQEGLDILPQEGELVLKEVP